MSPADEQLQRFRIPALGCSMQSRAAVQCCLGKHISLALQQQLNTSMRAALARHVQQRPVSLEPCVGADMLKRRSQRWQVIVASGGSCGDDGRSGGEVGKRSHKQLLFGSNRKRAKMARFQEGRCTYLRALVRCGGSGVWRNASEAGDTGYNAAAANQY
jgi:hypothetical protein